MTVATPKRLIVFFTHYGCLTNRWFPAKSHGALTTADYTAMPTLAPMAPYASKLLMVRGIRAMNEWSFDRDAGAEERSPHEPVRDRCSPLPADPQLPEQRGHEHREVRRKADRAIAGPHRRRGGQQPTAWRRRSSLPADRRRQRQRQQHPGRHLVVGRHRHDLPGLRVADAGLQQPDEPVRHGHRAEPGHLQGGARQERHRLRAGGPGQALGHQHERGRQAEADASGPSSSTTWAARSPRRHPSAP